MNKYRLGDLCLSITDGEHGSVKNCPSSNYYLLNNNNITTSGIEIKNSDRHISEADYKKIHKRTNLQKGDLVIATCGTLGKTQIISDDEINYEFSRSVGIIKCNKEKLLPSYLHYYFINPSTQYRIQNIAKGGVQKHFYINDMADFEIYLPDLPTQKKIADVLSCIDDKIALNNKTNSELENMAKTVYDYWFTQFDFPDANGNPYKSSGGKMEYNEVLKREIPAGWEVGKLSDIAVFSSKTTDTTKIENYITTDNILPNKQGIVEAEYIPTYGNVLVYEQNDILIANIRPYFKKIWLANKSGMCSNDVLCIKSKKEIYKYFLYRLLWRDDFFDYVMKGAKGSKMPRGDKNHIMNMPVVIPIDNNVLKTFNDYFVSIQTQIWNNQKENEELTKLRDYLLPLLMNGQIEVK